ncbi:MAG: MBL fold metallo-hydrolase [Chloroflexota bacterium]|nr:MAG: MBL fold metallo-hydrolase [Chloroflexota bacterium]
MMKKIILYSLFALITLAVLFAVFFTVRQAQAHAEIEREWQTTPASVTDLGTTTRLEIIPLYENDRVDESLETGHGVSYLIRTDATTVLMDLGHNPEESPQLALLKNMQALGIAWDEIDAIVISHPHPDHVGGVTAWRNQTVSFGEFSGDLSQITMYTPIPMTYPGVTTVHSAEPTLISADVASTGVIPFPEVFPISLFDPKGHEQGVIIDVAGKGLVLITGCGHPTMEKLVAHAEAVFDTQVIGVVGGLHYGAASAEDVQAHIQFLETRHPELVALSPHDSSPEVLEAFSSAFPDAYQFIRVGEAIQFP